MGQRRRQVLLVLDDPSLRRSVRRHLAGMGFDVAEAVDGESAHACVVERVPDLICLDLTLPTSSGYEVCEAFRKNPRLDDVPILMMSDRTSIEDRAYAYEAGADGYLTVPFSADELSLEVMRLLQEGRLGARGGLGTAVV